MKMVKVKHLMGQGDFQLDFRRIQERFQPEGQYVPVAHGDSLASETEGYGDIKIGPGLESGKVFTKFIH